MTTRLRWLALPLAASLVLVACSDDDDGDDTSATTEAPADTAATTATTDTGSTDTTAVAGEGATVAVGDSELGQVLVDPDGFTLYVFMNDEPGVSNCTDACADAWPPLTADEATAGDGVTADVSVFDRGDGTMQVAVNDQPVYRFAADAAPGDTTGQGTGGVWYVVTPDGTPLDDA